MAIDRRLFLKASATLGLTPIGAIAAADGQPAFVAARRYGDSYSIAVIDSAGRVVFSEPLSSRGHAIAVSPERNTAVLFARRPGTFAIAVDLANRRSIGAFAPPANRHFYGHGLYSGDGRLLFATENDFENERGVLGVYDVGAGFRRIGEFDTHGIGPHEAILMRDRRTIVVANGGIATHPDFARQQLNIPTMAPSLAYLDAGTGDLIEETALPDAYHQLSIRHIAEAADGTIWFGGQYEGGGFDPVALVGTHRLGGAPALVGAPDGYTAMRHYIGSVAVSGDRQRVAVTSPVGGRVLVFDATSRNLIDQWATSDVSGVAPSGTGFITSDGSGKLWHGRRLIGETADTAWDNHITAVG
ncbi:DUF1513 domain-containing protein [Bauldia sp.]|uniref:DUF1513 domain-containing protein n=1 Tax=Bauldia sp. TaxID=2575872 RepID=UPI003BA99160